MRKVLGVLFLLAGSANAFSGAVLHLRASAAPRAAATTTSPRAASTAATSLSRTLRAESPAAEAAQSALVSYAGPAQTCRNFNRASFRGFAKAKAPEQQAQSAFLQQLAEVPLSLIDGDGGHPPFSAYAEMVPKSSKTKA
mmetsp:Transcript_36755/g.31044  ORF Transcript_36755/g.31044 Transcript_36755/m.31044 type:complete len:140 (+) Transcript_36755:122-541(+)